MEVTSGQTRAHSCYFMHTVVHVMLTWVMFWLSVIFLDDEETFKTSLAFRVMAETMTENSWGVFTASMALAGILGMFTNTWRLKSISAAVLAVGHFIIAVEIYLGNPHGTGTGAYAGCALLAAALAYSTAHLGERTKKDLETPYPS